MSEPDVSAALPLWPECAGAVATLLNISENHTYRIDAESGRFILRLHRPNYQSHAAIGSELDWLAALSRDTGLAVPRPRPGRDGALLQVLPDGRNGVLFDYLEGREAAEGDDLVGLLAHLGRTAAVLHEHAETWTPTLGLTRPRLDLKLLDTDGLWGDWRRAPGVAEVREELDTIDVEVRRRLAGYGTTQARFGLIHADMRFANVLVGRLEPAIIDFDDCGFGWHLYDLAATLSFIEMRADLPDLIDVWTSAYARMRPLTAEDHAIIPALILFRRVILLAWIGSHGETALAQVHARGFAADTVALAGRLLP